VLVSPPSPGIFRFGSFQVDLRTGELHKHGTRVRLQEQPFKILAMLLARRGELVTREELRTGLWPKDTFVDFDHGLNAAVKRLRDTLNDSAEKPRFVETIGRRGYRFIATLDVVEEEPPEELLSASADLPKPHPPESTDKAHEAPLAEIAPPVANPPLARRALQMLVVVPALAVIVILAGLLFWEARRPSRHATLLPVRSLAVLPLEDLSGDTSQDYFADGLTDELITDLGQISALRVISRTSVMQYKGRLEPLPRIAQQLNVDAVVEGTVFRSGNRVRITAQLIDARSDTHLWAQAYEGGLRDVLTLQNTVATDIADQVRIRLTPHERATLHTTRVVDPAAHEAYFKGRYFWDKRTSDGIRKAIDYFEEAIRDDPNFAQPYAGLALVYAALPDYAAMPPRDCYAKARVAATRALQLDDSLPEAHTALAGIAVTGDYNWLVSEQEFQRAIQLNPGYADAYHWHAFNLAFMSRWDEAISEIDHARSLDPLSIIINANQGFVFYHARQFDQAIAVERRAMELDPGNPIIYEYLGLAYLGKGMHQESVASLRKAVDLSGGVAEIQAELAYAYAAIGDRAAARQILSQLETRSHREYVPSYSLSVAYAGLGDRTQALTRLEQAYEERCDLMPTINVSPLFDSLRNEPRFQRLVRRIAFPS
jgi:TolB-like protein/DNA-binding winged helix-turn-helix (wHTH) protein/tetratricopeptide (TPR) repeat protein